MKKIFTKLMALTLVLAAFSVLSGFSYLPNQLISTESATIVMVDCTSKIDEVNGNTGETGSFQETNGSFARKTWVGEPRQIDGKWGWSSLNWKMPFGVILDQSKFNDVHHIKIDLEIYSARTESNSENNSIEVRYYNTDGNLETYSQTISGGNDHLGQWKTYSLVIDDVDMDLTTHSSFKNLNSDAAFILYPNIVSSVTPLDAEGNALCNSYYGSLVHSITITPILDEPYTYKLEQAAKYDSINWDAVNGGDITWATYTSGGLKMPSATLTVTDSSGVTKTGMMSSSGHEFGVNHSAYFSVPESYYDIHYAQLEITYYDATNSVDGTKAQWQVSFMNQSGSSTKVADTWTQHSDKWITQTYTMENVDFSKNSRKEFSSPIQIYTNWKVQDRCTTDDESDDIRGVLIASVTITPLPEYSFSDLNFSDSNGNTISELKSSEEFHTDLTIIRKCGDTASDVTLIVALFDIETGRMEKISAQTKEMAATETSRFTTCFVCPEDVTNKVVKIFVWDSLTKLSPIATTLLAQ